MGFSYSQPAICMGCVRGSPLLVPEVAAAPEKGGNSASAAHDDSMGLEQAGLSSYAVMVRSCLLNLERLCLEKGRRRVRPEPGSPQSAGGQHQQRTNVQGITLIQDDPARSRCWFVRPFCSTDACHSTCMRRTRVAGVRSTCPEAFDWAALGRTRPGCRPDISFSRRQLDDSASAFARRFNASRMIT